MAVPIAREVFLVYQKELRILLRDRHTLLYAILLPLVLYPVLLWGTFQAATYVEALEERRTSSVIVSDETPGSRLRGFLSTRPGLRVEPWEGEEPSRQLLEARGVDAFLAYRLESPPAPRRAARATLRYNLARGSSAKARDRLEEALEEWRKTELAAAALEAGEPGDLTALLRVEERSITSSRERSEFLASLVLPLLSLVMMILGALYPALDSTVGERERGTLETTLVSPTRREAIVLGKYLAVVTLTLGSFALNFLSLGFTLVHLMSQPGAGAFAVELSPRLLGVALPAALLLALLIGAIVMLLAFTARSFREGQSYLTPVYLLAIAPSGLALAPEVQPSLGLALVPFANLVFVFREALAGRPLGTFGLVAFAASLGHAALALGLGLRLLRKESFVAGDDGLRRSWLTRILGRGPAPDRGAP